MKPRNPTSAATSLTAKPAKIRRLNIAPCERRRVGAIKWPADERKRQLANQPDEDDARENRGDSNAPELIPRVVQNGHHDANQDDCVAEGDEHDADEGEPICGASSPPEQEGRYDRSQ